MNTNTNARRRRRTLDTRAGDGLVHALLYRRVSGAAHQKTGVSLETQTHETRAYVGRQVGWVIDGEYEDIRSGRRADRPAYQALLARARELGAAGQKIAIVVLRMDRFGRGVFNYLLATKPIFEAADATIHEADEGGAILDEEAAIDKMNWAQKEGKRIGRRVRENRRTVVLKGWPYGRIAFGYRARPPTQDEIDAGCRPSMVMIEPDPDARQMVVQLFERAARGATAHALAIWLQSQPAERRGDYAWALNSVLQLLRNPTYIARPADGSDDVLARPVARWQPLVSDELWSAVQDRLERQPAGRHPSGQYLLTGFLKCSNERQRDGETVRCGARMSATGHGRRHYRCSSAQRGAKAPIPGCAFTVGLTTADTIVLDEIIGIVSKVAAMKPAELRQHLRREQSPALDDDVRRARRLAELERDEKRARDLLANALAQVLTDGDRQAYEALRDMQLAKIETIGAERATLGAPPRRTILQLPSPDDVLAACQGWTSVLREADVADQREVLDVLVESVRLLRIGWGKYEADITWTPLGEMLHGATVEIAA